MRQDAKERAETRERGAARPPGPGLASGTFPARRGDGGSLSSPLAERASDVGRDERAPRVGQASQLVAPLDPSSAPAAPPPAVLDPLDDFFWREDEVAPGFPDFGGVAPVRATMESEARTEWLTFFLAGEEYAVAIEQVREILKAPDITEVPRAPVHVLGVIMVRGEVIAILDPRRRLGLPTATPGRQARVLVCDAGDGPRGLLVDAVSNVVRLPPSSLEARPSGIGGPSAEFISGIGRDRDRLFILLDLAAVLRDAAPGRPAEAL